jgi:hypothetical protein
MLNKIVFALALNLCAASITLAEEAGDNGKKEDKKEDKKKDDKSRGSGGSTTWPGPDNKA